MGRGRIYHLGLTAEYEQTDNLNKELSKSFLNYLSISDKSLQTIDLYKHQLKIFFTWNAKYNNNKKFIQLRARDFLNYITYLKELKESVARIKNAKSILSSFSNFIELYYEDEYPDFKNRIRLIKIETREPVFEKTILKDSQVNEFLKRLTDAKEYQIACYVALLANSGMRKSEALQMRVDFFNSKHSKYKGDYSLYKTEEIRSKGGGIKGKQIPKYVFKRDFDFYLNNWLKYRKENNIKSEFLFLDKEGLQANKNTLNKFAKIISKKFGINFYAHCMRHYYCTKLKRKQWPEEVIQNLVKWSNPKMIKIYNDQNDEEVLDKFFNDLYNTNCKT